MPRVISSYRQFQTLAEPTGLIGAREEGGEGYGEVFNNSHMAQGLSCPYPGNSFVPFHTLPARAEGTPMACLPAATVAADLSTTDATVSTRKLSARLFLILSMLLASTAGAAELNLTPTGLGTTFPSGVGLTVSFAGTNPTAQVANGTPIATANTYWDPQIPLSQITYRFQTPGTAGPFSAGQEAQNGTITFTFTRPVTNPRFHISEWAASNGTGFYATAWTLDTAVAPGGTLSILGSGAGTRMILGTAPVGAGGAGMPRVRGGFMNGLAGGCEGSTTNGCGTIQVNGTFSTIRFFVAQRMNAAATPQPITPDVYSVTVTLDDDFSDAPASYGGAGHAIGGLTLGAFVAPAAGAHPAEADIVNTLHATAAVFDTANPLANNTAAGDSDNALAAVPIVGINTYALNVPVDGVQAASTAQLCGWIDFNRNGTFETTERACNSTSSSGSVLLSWPIPTGAAYVAGESYMRLRTGYTLSEVQNPTGGADSGEVEDYTITLLPRVRLTKALVPASAAGLFNLSVEPPSATAVQTSSGTVTDVGHGGTTGFVPVQFGTTVTVSESAGTGTSLSSYVSNIACLDRSGAAVALGGIGTSRTFTSMTSAPTGPPTTPNTANANLSEISCTATNSLLPTLQVVKVTQNGTGTFSFSGSNGIAGHDITTATANVGVPGPVQILTSPATATTVTESALPANYQLDGIACAGMGAGGSASVDLSTRTVTLNTAATSFGSSIVCTFTNIAQVADLTITKTNTPLAGDNDQVNDTLVRGASTQYTIKVGNNGPVSVSGAVVQDSPSSGLNCPPASTVTCSSTVAGGCPTSPTPILMSDLTAGFPLGTIPVGAFVTLTFTCSVQ
ncbi:hypothetical protein GLA29479_421 [Lysobacter antibioticus]|nr:hypothetical protein GLA29479_421 [Lysobacter antibioticus]